MARLNTAQIRDAAKQLLRSHPTGMRFTQLYKELQRIHPETNPNTIYTQVSTLSRDGGGEVVKPSRGVYRLAEQTGNEPPQIQVVDEVVNAVEAHFYQSFAEWLRDDLEEATEAAALGGAGQRNKWGTPDVVGTYKPQADYIYRFPIEIISAEIKIDPSQSVVAFGQTVAYRLFSHKTYLVMPTTLGEDELGRLEALSLIFGIGLVMFEVNRDNPNYSIRARAQRFSPDAFYVNEFMRRLSQNQVELFHQLF